MPRIAVNDFSYKSKVTDTLYNAGHIIMDFLPLCGKKITDNLLLILVRIVHGELSTEFLLNSRQILFISYKVCLLVVINMI